MQWHTSIRLLPVFPMKMIHSVAAQTSAKPQFEQLAAQSITQTFPQIGHGPV